MGQQPQIKAGEIFIYGSGCCIATEHGTMRGSLQFTNVDGQLFEVPICDFPLTIDQDIDD